jgi:hypothetical protein
MEWMAGFEPRVESLRCERDRVRTGDTDRVEAEPLGPLHESTLERLPV